MKWDLFCRVVDNFGDIGVCWRLAADLATRGEPVRLFVDDAAALAWMAPDGAPGVAVAPWPASGAAFEPADVLVEAFGCDLPEVVVSAMARRRRPPVWVNLEYLSAEAYVERSHRLPSPQSGAAIALTKWFFYPGFTAATGGLLREPGLRHRQAEFDAAVWLAARGVPAGGQTRVVSLFCYDNPALPDLLASLAQRPTVLFATAGWAASQVEQALGPSLVRSSLRAVQLPLMSQSDYDHLLWASDLNLVRGEDSWVRAQWAGKPFVWQAYPQADAAHRAKLEAFLDRFLGGAADDLAAAVRAAFRRWNGASAGPIVLPPQAPWQAHVLAWRGTLLAQADLCSQLLGFVAERR
jgi:uncharacterized repeat protein (TIGR03837 family)